MAITPVVTDQIPPVEIGYKWVQQFNYAPGGVTADLTGYSAAYVIKTSDKPGATTIESLATGGSGITVAATNPNITVTLTALQTAALSEARGYAFLSLTPGGGGVPVLWLKGPQAIQYAGG